MQTRVRVLGHPAHQMMVVFPLGLLIAAVVFDVIAMVSDSATLSQVAFWNIVAGLIGALIAAPLGLADWTGVPAGTRAKRVGLVHGAANALMSLLFLIAVLVRIDHTDHAAGGGLLVLEIIAVAIGGGGAWLGGELVNQHGIGVSERAGPDAPNSLSHRTVTR